MAASIQLCLSESRAPESSLMDDLRVASEAGFSALDLWAPKLDAYLATYPVIWLDAEMQKHRVHATSISGIGLSPSDDREARLLREARFLELCTDLDALGGETIVICPGTGHNKEADDTQVAPWLIHMSNAPHLHPPISKMWGKAHSSSALARLARRPWSCWLPSIGDQEQPPDHQRHSQHDQSSPYPDTPYRAGPVRVCVRYSLYRLSGHKDPGIDRRNQRRLGRYQSRRLLAYS